MEIAVDIGIELVLYKDRVETAGWGGFFLLALDVLACTF